MCITQLENRDIKQEVKEHYYVKVHCRNIIICDMGSCSNR